MNDKEKAIQEVVKPLLAAAHTTIRFDDIFQPDTLTWIETKNENPSRAMDLFFAKCATRNVALFLIHGGGWHSGSRRVHHNLMRAWNEEGYTCASADYILSDKGTILEQLRDVRHGYDLFQRILVERGQSPNIVVFGDSQSPPRSFVGASHSRGVWRTIDVSELPDRSCPMDQADWGDHTVDASHI